MAQQSRLLSMDGRQPSFGDIVYSRRKPCDTHQIDGSELEAMGIRGSLHQTPGVDSGPAKPAGADLQIRINKQSTRCRGSTIVSNHRFS